MVDLKRLKKQKIISSLRNKENGDNKKRSLQWLVIYAMILSIISLLPFILPFFPSFLSSYFLPFSLPFYPPSYFFFILSFSFSFMSSFLSSFIPSCLSYPSLFFFPFLPPSFYFFVFLFFWRPPSKEGVLQGLLYIYLATWDQQFSHVQELQGYISQRSRGCDSF